MPQIFQLCLYRFNCLINWGCAACRGLCDSLLPSKESSLQAALPKTCLKAAWDVEMRYLCWTVPAVVPDGIAGFTSDQSQYRRNSCTSLGLPQLSEGTVRGYTVISKWPQPFWEELCA